MMIRIRITITYIHNHDKTTKVNMLIAGILNAIRNKQLGKENKSCEIGN